MRFLNLPILLIFLLVFASVSNSWAQTPPILIPKTIEDEVARLLQNRDVGDLANELAQRKTPQTVAELLKNLSVYARAGHRARVHETLKQLPGAPDFAAKSNYRAITEIARKALGEDDLIGHRLFYELIAVSGDHLTESFATLWLRNGDVGEFEKWLAAREHQSEAWWSLWLRLKMRLGTADGIFAELEQKIRANPADSQLIEKYIRSAGESRSTAWLADVVPTDTVWEAYEVAASFGQREPLLAIKFFQKSLSLPFTEKDEEKFHLYLARSTSIAPKIKNPEKQLRFWTKKALAEAYRKNNQPQLAQPLIEELTAMDISDILPPAEVFGLAGQVQAASGQRVVEAKILRDEAENQNSPQYWRARVEYYMGRKEKELVWQTIQQAQAKFSYRAGDKEAAAKRLQIMRLVAWHGKTWSRMQAEEVFRREYAQAAKDAGYLFALTLMIAFDYDDFTAEIFAHKKLLPQILSTRRQWLDDERVVIQDVLNGHSSDPEKRKKRERVWDELAALARKDIRNRAYALAEAMIHWGYHAKAVPLLEACLQIAPENFQDGLNFNREYVEKELFAAYIKIGDWRAAERMFLGGYKYWGDELSKIALSAAIKGDTADAVRVWKMYANYDRRNLRGLEELAKTDAKPLLREFYLEMKKHDALTDVPDKALKLLQ